MEKGYQVFACISAVAFGLATESISGIPLASICVTVGVMTFCAFLDMMPHK